MGSIEVVPPEAAAPAVVAQPDVPPPSTFLTFHRHGPTNVRHRWTRAIVHHIALVAADAAALSTMVVLHGGLRDGLFGVWGATVARALVPAGAPGFAQYLVATLLGLAVTGNYWYGDHRRAPGRLLAGAALGMALVFWTPAWSVGVGSVVLPFVAATAGASVALLADRIVVDLALQRLAPSAFIAPRTLFVGTERDCRQMHERRIVGWERDYTYVGFVDPADPNAGMELRGIDDLPRILDACRVQWLVLCGNVSVDHFRAVLEAAAVVGGKVFAAPRWLLHAGIEPKVVWRRGNGFLELTPVATPPLAAALVHAPQSWYMRVGKRALDLVGATLGIAIGFVPMVVAALAMRLESRGGVFILQPRVGRGGRVFELVKLRTMVPDAERDGGPQWTVAGDPRITPVGRWIRRLRIDEIPQLVNVLAGQMSLVGPRPERPELHDQIVEHHPEFATRVAVKPGITGFAQIYDGYADSIESSISKLKHDRRYIGHVSLGLDLTLLAKTVRVVLTGHGSR